MVGSISVLSDMPVFAPQRSHWPGPAASTWSALLLATTLVTASSPSTLPYVPATILVPGASVPGLPIQNASSVVYILAPSGNTVDLLSLDIGGTLHDSSLGLQKLTSGVPFVDPSSRTATFTPAILANGSILVYSGDCSSTTTTGISAAVWTYSPPNSTTSGIAGSWIKHNVSGTVAPSRLGSALSFSSRLAPVVSPPSVYVYGGMCPALNQTASAWQTAANYSNQMLQVSSIAGSAAYTAGPIESRGPPIAEAGFTLTPLWPSISNRSGVVSQQVNSVLLGGHTQQAFIN